jgi:hypothetical protein
MGCLLVIGVSAKPIEKFLHRFFQKAVGVWGNAPCFLEEHFFGGSEPFFAIEKKVLKTWIND